MRLNEMNHTCKGIPVRNTLQFQHIILARFVKDIIKEKKIKSNIRKKELLGKRTSKPKGRKEGDQN